MLPLHVARLSDERGEAVRMCDPAVAEPEREWSVARGFIGEGGAYISDSWARAEGAVSPTRTCLTLSDWTCVLCREEWRATRRGEEGDKEGLLLKSDQLNVNDGDSYYNVHALFELEKVDSFVHCRIP